MELIELIRMGALEAFRNFSNPWMSTFAYLSVAAGFVIQLLCGGKAKTKIGRFVPLIVFVLGCLLCECAAAGLSWMALLAAELLYCLFLYLLIGALIACIVRLIRNRGKA